MNKQFIGIIMVIAATNAPFIWGVVTKDSVLKDFGKDLIIAVTLVTMFFGGLIIALTP